MFKPIEWEDYSPEEQLALAACGERSPLDFTAIWYNITQGDSFRPNWHHHYFNWAAQKVLSGEVQNLIVNIPPGGTKTEFWSVHLPVYCMTQFNRVRILNTSYSKDLVNENSERSRAIVKSAEFQQFYPFGIGKDKVDDWTVNNTKGKRTHQIFSRSSGGQITGVRGGYMSQEFSGYVMADDWNKPEDMFSDTRRNKAHTRLTNTLRSRRATSRTPFMFVQQRLHSEDGTWYLLDGGMGLDVDLHIKIPALINQDYIDTLPDGIREKCIKSIKGSKQIDGYWSYWPEKDSVDDLHALKQKNPYTFHSQYQQAPENLEGDIFSADDFAYYSDERDEAGHLVADLEVPPYYEYRFTTTDTAQKKGEANDWTVFAEWGVYQGRIYRLNYQRARYDAKELRREFESFIKSCWAKNDRTQGNLRAVMVEDKSSGTGLIQEMQGRLPIKVTAVPRGTGDGKYMRALDVQPHHSERKVVLPYGDRWNTEFVAEVASFKADDSHKFDDQTDVMVDAIEFAILRPATRRKRKVKRPGWMKG